jgi:hypothetical protein
MRRFRLWIACLFLVWLWGLLSPSHAAPTYYTLSDFQRYVRHADGSKQRQELLSQLSRQQIIVGVFWSNAAERDRKLQDIQTFLQQSPAPLPGLRQVKPGPSGSHFATYVITTTEDQSLAGVAVWLNTMQDMAIFDYALPVLKFSRGLAAPFIEFTAVFSPNAGTQAVASFLQRQPVTVVSHSGTTHTLRLHTQVATNVLVVIRAFEEATRLVDDVQPVWLDVRLSQPVDLSVPVLQQRPTAIAPVPLATPTIAARVSLDTGWDFSLVDVRRPVTYRLQIEHSPQVHVLPESIAPTALRRALARETALPPELFDITEAGTQTEQLSTYPNRRSATESPRGNGDITSVQVLNKPIRKRVEYTLRISKPGTYRIPALQVAYSLENSRRTVHQLQSMPQQGHLLTVDAHLPADTHALPGNLLTPHRLLQLPWPWLRHLALGLLAGGVLTLGVGLLLRVPRRQRPTRKKPLSPRQMRQQYQTTFQHLQDHMPVTSGPLSREARAWLRDCATLVRRVLGERTTGEPARFEGGAGVSAAMIRTHLQEITTELDTLLEPTLHLLQELDMLATAPAPTLTPEDYHRCSQTMQHIITSLINHEVSRVLRASTGL